MSTRSHVLHFPNIALFLCRAFPPCHIHKKDLNQLSSALRQYQQTGTINRKFKNFETNNLGVVLGEDLPGFINKALQHAPAPSSAPTQGFMPQRQVAQGGMYGNNSNVGYSQQQVGPQHGHAGYNQHGPPGTPGETKSYMPEIGNAPNMKSIIKGGSDTHYAYLNDTEEEDDENWSKST